MHGSFHTMQRVISCSPYNAQMVGMNATDQMLVVNLNVRQEVKMCMAQMLNTAPPPYA